MRRKNSSGWEPEQQQTPRYVSAWVLAWSFAKSGLWPEPGAMNQQPAKFLDIFREIENIVEEITEDKRSHG